MYMPANMNSNALKQIIGLLVVMFPEVSVSALAWHIKHCERQTVKKRKSATKNKTKTKPFTLVPWQKEPDQLESQLSVNDSKRNFGCCICLQNYPTQLCGLIIEILHNRRNVYSLQKELNQLQSCTEYKISSHSASLLITLSLNVVYNVEYIKFGRAMT